LYQGLTLAAAEKRDFLEGDGLQAVHNCFEVNAALFDDCKTNVQVSPFRAISKSALYQGTTSVVPKRASRTRALAPAALFPSQFGFGSVRQLNLRGGHYLCSIQ
jgi:hypothetical protein